MQPPITLTPDIRRAILVEIGERSLAAVGRELGVSASTLASAMTGSAREGTKVLVAVRWSERQRALEAEAPFRG